MHYILLRLGDYAEDMMALGEKQSMEIAKATLVQLSILLADCHRHESILEYGDRRVLIDCREMPMISPCMLLRILIRIYGDESGFPLWRFLVLLDPTDDLKLLFTWILQDMGQSLHIAYSAVEGKRIVVSEEFINLVLALEETHRAIKEHQPVTGAELFKIMSPGSQRRKPLRAGNMRERLRQLFRKGFITRQVCVSDSSGLPVFAYRAFTLINTELNKLG